MPRLVHIRLRNKYIKSVTAMRNIALGEGEIALQSSMKDWTRERASKQL